MVYLKVAYNFLEGVQTSYQSEGLRCARIFPSVLESASELVMEGHRLLCVSVLTIKKAPALSD